MRLREIFRPSGVESEISNHAYLDPLVYVVPGTERNYVRHVPARKLILQQLHADALLIHAHDTFKAEAKEGMKIQFWCGRQFVVFGHDPASTAQ